MAKLDVYDIITKKVIDRLEAGVVPWKMEWDASLGVPRNIEGRPYRGVNVFLLHATALEMGYQDHVWMTYKQAAAKGGQVRKGEEATVVIFWSIIEKETDEGEIEQRFILRYYNVFNVAQVDGIEVEKPETVGEVAPLPTAEDLVALYKDAPRIVHGGTRAVYRPSQDKVEVPKRENFVSSEAYYSTLFHELIHSTGHETRLSRPSVQAPTFGSEAYSKEELLAEMGSAFLCAMSGISPAVIDNQTAYISSWLSVLKDDKKMVIHAAGGAQRAVDYIVKSGETP